MQKYIQWVSHDDTLAAATRLLIVVVHVELFGRAVATARAATRAGRVALDLPVESPDLADNVEEGFLDIGARLGRRLDKLAAKALRQVFTL